MKAYLITTGIAFGLLTAVHIARIVVEGARLLRDPAWMAVTVAAAGLALWAVRLLRGGRSAIR